MAVTFADGYASPSLRKAVFDLLHPGSFIEFEVMDIHDAFPRGHAETGEEDAIEAVVCTLITAEGVCFQAAKESARRSLGRDKKTWVDRPPSPENYQTDCTQAMGRALTFAGIPMQVGPLRLILDFLRPPAPAVPRAAGGRTNTATGEIDGAPTKELTLEQEVAVAVADMDGPAKASFANWAKAEHGVTNIARSGDAAPALMERIQELRSG